jgi:hypothetical protein
MNKIEKYNYDEFKKDLPRYVVYLVYVDTNKPKEYEYYKKILSFNGSHKELIKYLEKEYKNLNNKSFFIVYKFGFHTGKKPLQGGPLSITISSLVKEIFFNKMKNEYDTKLVSGYTKDNKYKKFHGKIWFQRKWLNINGWSDDYLDCMTEGLLSGKVELLPLVVNMFNVYFGDICEKRKKKNTNEIYKLIDQLKKTEINKPTDTKEIEEKFKLIESLSKPKKKDKTNDINDILDKYDKYYYYIANNNKTILLSSNNDIKQAQKEALIKLKPNIDNLINKNVILVSINNVESEYKKDEKFNLIGGPIQIQLKYQIIKSKSKIIEGDGSVENVYLDNKYINENKNNLLVDLKSYVKDFKNNKLNSQQGIFNINKVKKKQDKRNSINDVINLMEEVKRTKINNKIDKDEINKLIKQLETKKEEPKKYKKSKDDYSDHPLSDFILNNSHLFSSRK